MAVRCSTIHRQHFFAERCIYRILTAKWVQSVSGVLVPNLTKLSEQEPTPLLPFEVWGVDAEQGYYALGDC